MALTKVPSNLDSITATTQSASDNSTNVATTAYVTTAVSNLVDGAPGALNTLNEIAAALNDDAALNTTLTTSIATKLPLAGGTMTGNISHGGNFSLDVTGNLTLDADGDHVVFAYGGSGEVGRFSNESQNLVLYSLVSDKDLIFNGVDSGSTITALTLDMSNGGRANFGNDVGLNDNRAIRFGADDDLSIFHDGSDSYIRDSGTGLLFIRGSAGVRIQGANSEAMVHAAENGQVELYYDNSKKLETTNTGTHTSGTSLSLKTTSSTSNDRAGAGFTATESATDGDRRATMFLDADNGAFSTGNSGAYFYMEKKGAGGEVNFINQDTADMNFQTGGAHKRITIKGAGNVGIGIDNPDGKVHIVQGSAGSVTASTDKNTLVVENSSHGGITTLTPDGVESGIFFGHASDNRFGELYTHLNNNLMTFGTRRANAELKIMSGNAVEAIRVDGSGNVGIGTTNPTAPLHIATTTDDAYSLRLEGATNNAANYHGIGFAGESANTKAAILFKDIAVSYARGDMLFCLNNTADQSSATDADAVMTLKNDGVMKLMGGVTTGRQDLLFNNSYMSITNESTYTLSGVLNTGALIAIGANRSNVGVTYDHCLIFAEMGTAATVVANPSGRFAINSATTANKVNVFVNGSSVVIQNKVASTVGVTVAAFVFQGN